MLPQQKRKELRILDLIKNSYGAFVATNGSDTVVGTYARGKKDNAGKFHPCWTLTCDGVEKKAYVSKPEALELADQILTHPLPEPLTTEEAAAMQKKLNRVHGIVAASLGEIMNRGRDDLIALLNSRLYPEPLISPSFYIVGIDACGMTLHFRFSGVLELSDPTDPAQCRIQLPGDPIEAEGQTAH